MCIRDSLQPVLVTPQLSFDLVSRTIESQMCILGRMRTLEDNALHDMRDNVAPEAMNEWSLSKGCLLYTSRCV